MSETQPDWYDESKLCRAYFADYYRGWVIDLGDGTCRFANTPLLGEDGPGWGDRVRLIPAIGDGLPRIDHSEIIEKYSPVG